MARLGGADGVAIEVSADPPSVAPGGTSKIAVAFKNTTQAPRTLGFADCEGDPPLSIDAFQNGERADLAQSDFGCGVSRGCMVRRVAVTLAPGGAATTRGSYRAQKKKLGPPCTERPIGPLAAGQYELRFLTPLLFVDPDNRSGAPSHRPAAVALRVGK